MEFRVRGAKEGICNICGELGPLTEDHTPPKGCVRPTALQIQHLMDALSAEHAVRRKSSSNNGVRFKSLCARCNNAKLGGEYDPALISFTSDVARYATSRIALPPTIQVRAQPQKIARAVWGHLAAAAVNGYGQWKDAAALKEWFLTGAHALPPGLRMHYWFYPHQPQIIVRGFGFFDTSNPKAIVVGWVMKFFPLAFLIASTEDPARTLTVPELVTSSNRPLDFEIDLPVPLRPVVRPHWPEAPGNTGVVLMGDHALHALPKQKRGA